MINSGIIVEYWDVTGLFHNGLSIEDSVDREYIRKIASYTELEQRILSEDNNKVIYVPQVYYQAKVLKLLRLLSKYNCRLYYFSWGLIPGKGVGKLKNIIANMGNINGIKRIWMDVIAQLLRKINYVKYYDVVFAAGSKAAAIYEKKSMIVKINHYDYDKYLSLKMSNIRINTSKYCVFLDDGFPEPSDFRLLNTIALDSKKYFNAMNKIFDMLEQKYGIEVVVAAHPKSGLDQMPFNRRKIFKYKTADLVKDCEFVIAHVSTSISFPVLFKKPVIFIYTDDFKELYMNNNNYFKVLCNFAKVLDCKICNADKILKSDEIEVGKVNVEKYADYKYDYLTSKESESKPTNDILIEYLQRGS
jgi:hypothetical protein